MTVASSGPAADGEGGSVVEMVELEDPADEPAGEPATPTGDPAGEQAAEQGDEQADEPLAYEIVFDCKDKMLGARLANRLDEVLGPTYDVRRSEEPTGWAVVIEFPSSRSADRFFESDFYRQFCIEARRSCRSAVLVVPLGPIDPT